jgi:hypothetical protein
MARIALVILTLGAMASGASSLTAKQGQVCGGVAGIRCKGSLWCEPAPGQCNVADVAGKCVKATKFCTRIFKPVCGCDDKTYGNDCERIAAKIAKKSDGTCRD